MLYVFLMCILNEWLYLKNSLSYQFHNGKSYNEIRWWDNYMKAIIIQEVEGLFKTPTCINFLL